MIQATEVGLISFRNEWQKASISILYTHGFLRNSQERFFKTFGLTDQQYHVLRLLREQFPKPVSTFFLRAKMLDRMSDISRLVDRLEGKGLVESTRCTGDKRLVNVLISDKGQEVLGVIDRDLNQLDAMMGGLIEEEARQLVELLCKARQSLKTMNERLSATE